MTGTGLIAATDGKASSRRERQSLGSRSLDQPLVEADEFDRLTALISEMKAARELDRVAGAKLVADENLLTEERDRGRKLDDPDRLEVLAQHCQRLVAFPDGECSFAAPSRES